MPYLISSLPQNHTTFMKSFPSSNNNLVCTVDGETPSLLWAHLEVRPFSQRYFVELEKKSCVHLFLGVSGCGKTRTLLELGVQKPCLYFVGSGGQGTLGSRDVTIIGRCLLRLYSDKETEVEQDALSCCIGAAIIGRLYLYKALKEFRSNCSNLEWLFFQTEYPARWDVFHNLAEKLIGHFILSQCCDFSDLNVMFKHAVWKLQSDIGWLGFIVIDECQELNKMLVNRFSSTTLGYMTRSMLNPFVQELSDFNMNLFFISGSGATLLAMRTIMITGSMKNHAFIEHSDFPGFDSIQEMQEYAKQFIDTQSLDFEVILCLYRGRRRFFVTTLERFLKERGGTSTQFFIDFVERSCSETGATLGVMRSTRDDVDKLWRRGDEQVKKLVRSVVFQMYYYGVDKCIFTHPSSLALVEYGLGRLHMILPYGTDSSSSNKRQVLYKKPLPGCHEEDALASEEHVGHFRVKIDEPLVTMALLKRLSMDRHEHAQQTFADASDCAEHFGKVWEVLTVESLGRYFHGRAPVEVLSEHFDDLPKNAAIYSETCELVQSEVQGYTLVKSVNNDYRLLHWLEAIETRKPSYPTFLHTGPEADFGPDMIFMLKSTKTNRFVPVLCQMRFGKPDELSAFASLDAASLYTHNRTGAIRKNEDQQGVAKIQEWCATGYLQLVVATPLEDLRSTVRGHYPDRKSARLDKRKGTTSNIDPLIAVVDRRNSHLLLDPWIGESISVLKPNRVKRRKM